MPVSRPIARSSVGLQIRKEVTCYPAVVAKVAFKRGRRRSYSIRVLDLSDQEAPGRVQAHEKSVVGAASSDRTYRR